MFDPNDPPAPTTDVVLDPIDPRATTTAWIYLDRDQIEWVEDNEPGDLERVWEVTVDWATVKGRMECVGLAIRSPDEAERPLTSGMIRKLPTATIIRKSRKELGDRVPRLEETVALIDESRMKVYGRGKEKYVEALDAAGAVQDVLDNEPFRGGYPSGHYLEVALVYHLAWRNGERPTRAVAERWDVTRTTAGKWVYTARTKFHYLEPTTKRVPNGRLTEKARALLENERGL